MTYNEVLLKILSVFCKKSSLIVLLICVVLWGGLGYVRWLNVPVVYRAETKMILPGELSSAPQSLMNYLRVTSDGVVNFAYVDGILVVKTDSGSEFTSKNRIELFEKRVRNFLENYRLNLQRRVERFKKYDKAGKEFYFKELTSLIKFEEDYKLESVDSIVVTPMKVGKGKMIALGGLIGFALGILVIMIVEFKGFVRCIDT